MVTSELTGEVSMGVLLVFLGSVLETGPLSGRTNKEIELVVTFYVYAHTHKDIKKGVDYMPLE